MEFKINSKKQYNTMNYHSKSLEIANEFAKEVKAEMMDFVSSMVLFGSSSKGTNNDKSDIDILVIQNDLDFKITSELTEAYRIITQKLVSKISPKIHITTMLVSAFWQYAKDGDPVVVNILRDGVILMDEGTFAPLQQLLHHGRIRPTQESIWRYYERAPQTILNSKWRITVAVVDLYWAVIDAAHAILMALGEVPPSPEHVADIFDKVVVEKEIMEEKDSILIRKFYRMSKMVSRREIKDFTGAEYDNYYQEAGAFVERVKNKILKIEHIKKQDNK